MKIYFGVTCSTTAPTADAVVEREFLLKLAQPDGAPAFLPLPATNREPSSMSLRTLLARSGSWKRQLLAPLRGAVNINQQL